MADKLLIDLSGPNGPEARYVALTPEEEQQRAIDQKAAAAERAAEEKAATERAALAEKLKAGTATPAETQAALASLLGGG